MSRYTTTPLKYTTICACAALLAGCAKAERISLPDTAQLAFDNYLSSEEYPDFKAFAVDPGTGRWGRSWGFKFISRAIERALDPCGGWGGGCQVYAIGNTVVSGMIADQIEDVIEEYHRSSPHRLVGYRDLPRHKALARSPDGPYGWWYGSDSLENILRGAIENCGFYVKLHQRACTIYEIDGAIASDVIAAQITLGTSRSVNRTRRFASEILPVVTSARTNGITSLRGFAGALNAAGVKSKKRGGQWAANTVFHELTIYGSAHFEEALATQEKELGREHSDLAENLNKLGALYRMQGRYQESEAVHKRALAILEASFGTEHPGVAQSFALMADLEHFKGQTATGEQLYKKSLALLEKALGPVNLEVAIVLDGLADLYHSQAKYEEAEPIHKRALLIKTALLGPEHAGVAETLVLFGELYRAQKRYGEAEPLFRRALQIWENVLGPEHPDFATSLENYAFLLRKAGKEAEAAKMQSRANEIRTKLGQQIPTS